MSSKKYVLVFLITTLTLGAILVSSFGETATDNAQLGAQGSKSNITERGPLRVRPSNPRYFTDGSGKVLYLTGSHTWNNLVDEGTSDPPSAFDYAGYINFLTSHNHNFMRMWAYRSPKGMDEPNASIPIYATPQPWPRAGPGYAADGKLKFDLSQFNQSYFDRMRSRIVLAQQVGIYVAIMLFEGWWLAMVEKTPGRVDGWSYHPFKASNNINGLDADVNGDDLGLEFYNLSKVPAAILAIQEKYVKKVIDTVNDLDNVVYEIVNEAPSASVSWQYHFINFVKNYEATKSKQHPIGMTTDSLIGNSAIFNSTADWVSPTANGSGGEPLYATNPPAADGNKVVICDTDHLWGIGGDHQWVWKSFLRGLNPIFMDPYTVKEHQNHPSKREWDLIRKNMGYTLTYSKRVDLASMVPRNDLSSSMYCLANAGREYLIYLPSLHPRRLKWFYRLGLHKWLGWAVKLVGWNEIAIVDLSASSGTYRVEWLNPRTGETTDGGSTECGAKRSFRSPFTGDAVLYIYRP